MRAQTEHEALLEAARAGGSVAFGHLVEPLRAELRAHVRLRRTGADDPEVAERGVLGLTGAGGSMFAILESRAYLQAGSSREP
ncbi:hypothetical protein AB0M95_02325 [Sphaerisporangium sp. NPDC051017]|uniref:hypothetical protein n=1 Tax=Sphaerisporangium sp. NPDC051017 TaxID=3154636 RepID=UPI003441B5DB